MFWCFGFDELSARSSKESFRPEFVRDMKYTNRKHSIFCLFYLDVLNLVCLALITNFF